MNLCRTVGRKEARLSGVAATADRVCCEEAYGSRPPPPKVFGRYRPQTSSREIGRRRRSRRRPRCCGRGEAAGNCVNAAEAFSTALVDRVPYVLGTRAATAPEFSPRVGPTGSIGQDHKTRTELKGRRTQGGEQRVRGRMRHRTPNLCRTRARRIHRTTIATITSDANPGATARS